MQEAKRQVNAPVVKVASAVSFPVPLTEIAEGSQAREEFEETFKVEMSRRLNNLTVYITAIRKSGSRRRRQEQRVRVSRVSHSLRRQLESSVEVDFYTEAPVSVATQVASMVTTLAQSDTKISVAMKGGRTISADPKTLSLPTVTKTPDVDCAGGWST